MLNKIVKTNTAKQIRDKARPTKVMTLTAIARSSGSRDGFKSYI